MSQEDIERIRQEVARQNEEHLQRLADLQRRVHDQSMKAPAAEAKRLQDLADGLNQHR